MRQQLYLKLLELLYQAQVGHIGSCLSCLDIIINTLTLQMKPQDKFILSKGHAAPSLYVVLNYLKKPFSKKLVPSKQPVPSRKQSSLPALKKLASGLKR